MAQAQTASLAKWRGRHYAARVRAASQQQQRPKASVAATAATNGPAAAPMRSAPNHAQGLAPNESLTRRLQNSRFHNPRFQPSGGAGGGAGGGGTASSKTSNTTTNKIHNTSNSHHFVGKSNQTGTVRTESKSNNNNNNNNNISYGTTNNANDKDKDKDKDNTNSGGSSEMELVRGISDRLETGLNDAALSAILELLERGEHPESIVAVVTSLAQRPR